MSHSVLPDNREDQEAYLREHDAAQFVEAIDNARRDELDTIIFTLGAFAGEPELLYVALDYASHCGVDLTIPAHHGRAE